MSQPYRNVSTRQTGQQAPIPGEQMVENSEGAFVYEVDDWTRLRRFLVLGSEGGSFYAGEDKLTLDNAEALLRCVQADGERTVGEIVEVSQAGRAIKNDPAIFALAVASAHADEKGRRAAFAALPGVCRTGTHLFQFVGYREQFGGWGRGMRRAVAGWYSRELPQVAYQAVKYRQRDGWTHRDLLRLAHVEAETPEHDLLFRWTVKGGDDESVKERFADLYPDDGMILPEDHGLRAVEAFERAQRSPDALATVGLIDEYGGVLPREALLTEHLASTEVQEAQLAAGVPMTALIRNLGNLTKSGVLSPGSNGTRAVLEQLADEERLRKARVHPISVLVAMRTYQAGRGLRGKGTWDPVAEIVDALDAAFYAAFGNVEPTGKRTLLALDVSGSMSHPLAGIQNLNCREASTAMALVTHAVEQHVETVAFASKAQEQNRYGYGAGDPSQADFASPAGNDRWGLQLGLTSMPMSRRQRLDDAMRVTSQFPMLGTDCALPMLYASAKEREVDTFIVYTDSETWAGDIHPAQALRDYRRQSGIEDAALVVVGMVPNRFSIADPNDPRMLDVVGFDTSAPNAISAFARGEA